MLAVSHMGNEIRGNHRMGRTLNLEFRWELICNRSLSVLPGPFEMSNAHLYECKLALQQGKCCFITWLRDNFLPTPCTTG